MKRSGRKRPILVTGAGGFLGRYIVSEMMEAEWAVIGLDQRSLPTADPVLQQIAEWHSIELPSSALDELLCRLQPEVLIHAAGPASVPASLADPASDFHSSVDVFFHTLDSVRRKAPGCRVVFLSSAAVYGNPLQLPVSEEASLRPLSPYGSHKLICEKIAEEFHELFKVRVCSVRTFSAYGNGLRRQVLWDICQQALREPIVKLLGTGEEARDFVHARDVARAIALIASNGSFEGEVYNLGTGQETSIQELARILLAALGQCKEVYFSGRRRTGDPVRWCANIARLSELGYRPSISISEGTKEYARWVMEDRLNRD